MSRSKIEWCDRVWNPITGCTRVSPGCVNCYAIRQSHRFSKVPGKFEGSTVQSGDRVDWSGKVTCHEDLLDLPLRWKKPSRIFVNSMSDLFHDDVPETFIDQIIWRMAWCKRHTFMILTKRPMRMKAYCEKMARLDRKDRANRVLASGGVKHFARPENNGGLDWPLKNVWLGVSCENQQMADQRIPHLLKTPAAVRFVSIEPMLGAVELQSWLQTYWKGGIYNTAKLYQPAIDWVICGGESGPGARPMHPDWARSVRDQCKAADVPFFFKQWGEWLHESQFPDSGIDFDYFDVKCGQHGFARVGKKRAGRLLDGVEYSEWPDGQSEAKA